ncbi:hypothetical protein J1N35_024339 [Gossypium stocksii]|uniref:Uncharacterized protein n=1 Tax=Gossypium stocksii TaxID=47602 RepID=A0A9D3V4K2_9ROSI|nr:hypothetical protein J1N35_024339 [Gossypium stocksii]
MEVCDEEENDPMVVTTTIAEFKVKMILVDSGSVVEVLTWDMYQKMGLKEQALKKVSSLYDFANHPAKDGEHTTVEYVQFFVIDHPMACNAIFGASYYPNGQNNDCYLLYEIQIPYQNGGKIYEIRPAISQSMSYVISQTNSRARAAKVKTTRPEFVISIGVSQVLGLDVRIEEIVRKPEAVEMYKVEP